MARTIRGQVEDGRADQLAAAAFSLPDAKGRQRWLAVGGFLAEPSEGRDAIRLHDFASGEVRALLKGHIDNVLALAFSPSGRWLASAGKDHTVRLCDLSALRGQRIGSIPLVLKGHKEDRITDLAWSDDLWGNFFLSSIARRYEAPSAGVTSRLKIWLVNSKRVYSK